jgi:succinate-acetate transporter protein
MPAESEMTRIVLRPMATPLPLGLLGLFLASLLLSAQQLSWVPAGEQHLVLLAVLVFSVPLQATACLFGFPARDPVAVAGMGTLCVTWAATTTVGLLTAPGAAIPVLGVLLVAAGVALLMPTVVASAGKVLAAVVFAAAALRFAATGVYELTGSASWQLGSGIGGLVVAGLAGYAALAFEIEGALGRTVLPTLRRHAASRALAGSLREQIEALHREAGVREEL